MRRPRSWQWRGRRRPAVALARAIGEPELRVYDSADEPTGSPPAQPGADPAPPRPAAQHRATPRRAAPHSPRPAQLPGPPAAQPPQRPQPSPRPSPSGPSLSVWHVMPRQARPTLLLLTQPGQPNPNPAPSFPLPHIPAPPAAPALAAPAGPPAPRPAPLAPCPVQLCFAFLAPAAPPGPPRPSPSSDPMPPMASCSITPDFRAQPRRTGPLCRRCRPACRHSRQCHSRKHTAAKFSVTESDTDSLYDIYNKLI